jgi:hypothetical protein
MCVHTVVKVHTTFGTVLLGRCTTCGQAVQVDITRK